MTAPLPAVAIYRDHLLPASETFIPAQAEALRSFAPVYVGARRVPGLALPPGRTIVLNEGTPRGRAEEVLFHATGWAPRLERALHRLRPALLHAHFGTDALYALPLSARLRIPLVVTFHGYDVTARPGPASSRAHRSFARRAPVLGRGAAALLAVSKFIRGKLLAAGFDPGKVHLHYIGVDTAYFSPTDAPREEVVLFVGRLTEVKGCAILLEVMRRVVRDRPEAALVVIGEGPLRGELERGAAGLACRFLGAQPPAVVRDWMRRAKVLCGPSMPASDGQEEALGMAFLEAQACGLPPVGFSTGGVAEAVEDGRTGYLVPPGNAEQLAERITSLLRDESGWRTFSDAGVTRVRADFDLRRQTAALEEIYARVAESPR